MPAPDNLTITRLDAGQFLEVAENREGPLVEGADGRMILSAVVQRIGEGSWDVLCQIREGLAAGDYLVSYEPGIDWAVMRCTAHA